VLTAHPEGCALVYPEAEWEPVRAQVEKFPAFHAQAAWWKRLLLGFEEHVQPDGSGRILVSPALREASNASRWRVGMASLPLASSVTTVAP